MKVAAVVTDLMLFSRIEAAAAVSGVELLRVDHPEAIPSDEPPDLVLVDWSGRRRGWADALASLRSARSGSRVVVFGPHTDLEAHADARQAGLGPMWARSKLMSELPALLAAR